MGRWLCVFGWADGGGRFRAMPVLFGLGGHWKIEQQLVRENLEEEIGSRRGGETQRKRRFA